MMRKLLCAALVFCVLLPLAGCGFSRPPAPPASFRARADVAFGADVFCAEVTQTAPGMLTAAFTAPAELAGLVLRLENGTAVLEYQGLHTELPADALPQSGFAVLLSQALWQLAQPDLKGVRTAQGWLVKSVAPGGIACSALLDQDGALRTLAAPGLKLKIKLTPFFN